MPSPAFAAPRAAGGGGSGKRHAGGRGRKSAATIAQDKARLEAFLAPRRERERRECEERECATAASAASSAPEPPCAEDEDVVELGEVTRAQRDAEGIASAIELDGDESPRSMSRMTQRRRR